MTTAKNKVLKIFLILKHSIGREFQSLAVQRRKLLT